MVNELKLLPWFLTATYEDVAMALVEDGSVLTQLQGEVSALSHAVETQKIEIERLSRGRGVRADPDDPATALGNEEIRT